ncbi:ABC transporter substrate-binding protein [Pedobacter polysacchareus]|uniref:ABC transporter substrate-binding protein n=1 Tax=Pedobacter polysacchareus TaxID=2861973 RepID=UPI001C99F0B9|nr:ABC transporter substrate-binding protein [Pedobacter polysacchareus]
MKTGILLPRSTTHPLIAFNFMDGLHAYLKQHQLTNEIECVSAFIGFGEKAAVIQEEAERLLMEQRVDLLVVFADYPLVNCLFPIVAALNKLLIVVNHGAKYPDRWTTVPNVIHHHLNNASNCWLTGKQAAAENKTVATVNSYYDGGYSITHALYTSFLEASGKIAYNFVGHQQKAQFSTQPLTSFLDSRPELDTLLAILSGELVPEFYDQLSRQYPDRKLKLYASPVLLEESSAEENLFSKETIEVSGFTTWFKELDNHENETFCRIFTEETNRVPNSFGVLGWDTGLILRTILEISGNKAIDGKRVAKDPALKKLQGAKGEMLLHEETGHYLSPAHYLHSNLADHSRKKHSLSMEEVEKSFNEMIQFKLEGISSQWLNTYLCS